MVTSTLPLFQYFLPCAAGVEPYLDQEIARIAPKALRLSKHGGVAVRGTWEMCMQLNLHSRLAQRVLLEVAHAPYEHEQDIYELAFKTPWEKWFTPAETFRIDSTSRRSPLHSLNFALLRVKDGIVDRFRDKTGERPSVDTHFPHVQVLAHFDEFSVTFYMDTSGEALFKRGWRQIQGDAPLKETLAAAMIAASNWDFENGQILLDPCCGSGTIAIEAAQIACGIAPGSQRRFAFERLKLHNPGAWAHLKQQAKQQIHAPTAPIFASDVSFRMVDFAQRNAERAGVSHAIEFHGGDALQRPAPAPQGMMLINPPYGERISPRGSINSTANTQERSPGFSEDGYYSSPTQKSTPQPDHTSQTAASDDFFPLLASHWKRAFDGWTAWVLTPDMKLPQLMRLKATRRVPMWNGPIECRLMRFDIVAGSARTPKPQADPKTT